MAAPYKKTDTGDAWDVLDDVDVVIATVQTETMANALLASLLGVYPPPPDYPADEPLGEAEEGGAADDT